MPEMTYGSLVGAKTEEGSIRNWINVADLPVEAILTDALSTIYASLRVREMMQRATIIIGTGVSSVPLPDRFLDPLSLVPQDDQGGCDLVEMTELERLRCYDSNGVVQGGPITNATVTSTLDFNAAAQTARRLTLFYYATPEALGPNNQTNFLTIRYPQIVRAATAAMAADFRHDDENYTRWSQRAGSLIQAATIEGDLAKRGQIFARGFSRA